MKRIGFALVENWRGILLTIGAILLVSSLYLVGIGSLPKGLNQTEFANWQIVSLHALQPLDLIRNAIWLPDKLWMFALQYLPLKHELAVAALRGFSALVALVAIFCFYVILRRWYSLRIALLGSALFACSSWLLHTGRYASENVLYLLPLLAIAAWSQLQTGRHRTASLIVAITSGILCLYVPGLIWLVLPAFILQHKFLRRQLTSLSPGVQIALIPLMIVLLLPLAITLAWPSSGMTNLDAMKAFIGLPVVLPSVSEALNNAGNIFTSLVWHGNGNPAIFTGQAPLIGVFGSVMFVLGLYDFVRNNLRLDRTKTLAIYLVLGLALITMNGIAAYAVLIPVIYLIIVNGIRYMLQDWLSVFPRNPVARGVGIGLMTFVIAITVSYQLVSYFIAWPHTPAAKSSFTYKI